MPVGEGMVPVIEVGAIPADVMVVEPGGAKLSLKTFAEAAFGLRIDVDAFDNTHVNWSVLMVERSGRLKSDDAGNGAGRDCGRLAAVLGWAGWDSE